ncbi:hypothetical protein [Cohnella rhizosphaerae]|uniref:Uncharacterized protein n=1 Tax=Cohnella rhizosphaerae TaxID=1457232 RepID=A0A9X4QSN3_9BACL|nr:hypothetical protein [Cohnella rhizosphaerae]MDG0809503.1 hypothetical protein [Cohnella rhizosphaerae]
MNIRSYTSASETGWNERRSDELLQDILQALRQVVPLPLDVTDPRSEEAQGQEKWGVLIGVTGGRVRTRRHPGRGRGVREARRNDVRDAA